MATVTIEQLTKTFSGKPPTVAADSLDLTIEDGEFVVLLGPSGCGKTTTLRCLAGLEDPDEGRIQLDGRPVFDAGGRVNLPPDRRSIGMVFQSYALWPHLTVRKNIEFPLKARKLKQGLAEDWVGDVARLVECDHLLDRLPGELSGGQQQRIALARGLVARPGLVLFDEPMSNLDAKLRDQVRSQLHELHRRLEFTAVFVTHDQTEAFALADRLVILRSGRLEQCDTARRVWCAPASDYVAAFIGMSNALELHRTGDGWALAGHPVRGATLPVASGTDAVVARLRPADLAVAPSTAVAGPGQAAVEASFVDSTFGGDDLDVTVEVGGHRLQAVADVRGGASWVDELEPGAPLQVLFRPEAVCFFHPETGRPATAPSASSPADAPTTATTPPAAVTADRALS